MRELLVVKCGGRVVADPSRLCAEIAELVAAGTRVVLVHGGSADIERLAGRLGVADRRVVAPDGIGTRYTDGEMCEVVLLALAGLAKPRLVAALVKAGVPAVGLTGLDGGLLRARRKHAVRAVVEGRVRVVRGLHSGRIAEVCPTALHALLDRGLLPVVSPPALDENGEVVNTDADRVAAAVAGALGASALVLLTGVPGVLADPTDSASRLPLCTLPHRGPPPYTAGGIGTKLLAARQALLAGVPTVMVADGRVTDPVRAALAGSGTRITVRPDAREVG